MFHKVSASQLSCFHRYSHLKQITDISKQLNQLVMHIPTLLFPALTKVGPKNYRKCL